MIRNKVGSKKRRDGNIDSNQPNQPPQKRRKLYNVTSFMGTMVQQVQGTREPLRWTGENFQNEIHSMLHCPGKITTTESIRKLFESNSNPKWEKDILKHLQKELEAGALRTPIRVGQDDELRTSMTESLSNLLASGYLEVYRLSGDRIFYLKPKSICEEDLSGNANRNANRNPLSKKYQDYAMIDPMVMKYFPSSGLPDLRRIQSIWLGCMGPVTSKLRVPNLQVRPPPPLTIETEPSRIYQKIANLLKIDHQEVESFKEKLADITFDHFEGNYVHQVNENYVQKVEFGTGKIEILIRDLAADANMTKPNIYRSFYSQIWDFISRGGKDGWRK